MMLVRIGLSISLAFTLPLAQASEPIGSAETRIDFGECSLAPGEGVVGRHNEGFAHWICSGFSGIPVHIGEGARRYLVSFGRNGDHERAFQQSFALNNSISQSLEWRFEQAKGKKRPFAVIQTWITQNDNRGEGRVIVVTSLPPRPVCHVAIIDAMANREPMRLARQSADAMARGFECGSRDPMWIGFKSDLTSQRLE